MNTNNMYSWLYTNHLLEPRRNMYNEHLVSSAVRCIPYASRSDISAYSALFASSCAVVRPAVLCLSWRPAPAVSSSARCVGAVLVEVAAPAVVGSRWPGGLWVRGIGAHRLMAGRSFVGGEVRPLGGGVDSVWRRLRQRGRGWPFGGFGLRLLRLVLLSRLNDTL
jgi:hypothetical protein